MRKKLVQLFSALLALAVPFSTLALTDPEPNPFAMLEAGEAVYEGAVTATDGEFLTVQNSAEESFDGEFSAILKYRDGGGPADSREFAVGDTVRFIGTEAGGITAVQNADLLLCDQNFYGWVRAITDIDFQLELVSGEDYIVQRGATTQYRDEDGELLFGYTPRVDDIVRIHGVYNANSKQVFTDTFGAYITLLSEEALEPILNELAEARAVETAADEDSAEEFADVVVDYAYRRAIGFVKREGIVAGYPDGTYRPDATINRAEFAKILVETRFADQLPTELTESCFPDFTVEDWFARYVCTAKEQGILAGYPDGSFRPSDPVNLAEALKIIVSSFAWTIPDSTAGEAWYVPYQARATELQVLPSDFAQPSDPLTRGQMAELILRSLKHERGELTGYLAE